MTTRRRGSLRKSVGRIFGGIRIDLRAAALAELSQPMAAKLIATARQVYAALGFTYHLKGGPGSLHKAIDYYHQALGLKSEDTFATEMLRKAFEEIAGEPF
jgi:hypothetical protein